MGSNSEHQIYAVLESTCRTELNMIKDCKQEEYNTKAELDSIGEVVELDQKRSSIHGQGYAGTRFAGGNEQRKPE